MNERVVIDLNRTAFDNAVLMALEKDTFPRGDCEKA